MACYKFSQHRKTHLGSHFFFSLPEVTQYNINVSLLMTTLRSNAVKQESLDHTLILARTCNLKQYHYFRLNSSQIHLKVLGNLHVFITALPVFID